MSASRTPRQIWAVPAALGSLTMAGLISALLADGVWDALSWALLAVPLAVAAFYAFRPAARKSP